MRTASRPSLSPGPRTARRPARGEEGAAAVEAAIVLPLILLLLFGIIDFGRALQQQALLTSAVREGARTGALNGTAAAVQTKVQSIAGMDVTVVSSICTSGSLISADASVTATQPFTALTPVFALMQYYGSTTTLTSLRATGVMACTG
ncbi:TadE/TadG family type IV pilus assembly protein [Actinoplanes sp. M2I2]|uniref:TadE/TadG family type IV pilus assembly protein n=1 Tax=Actinoplanes sp. M2I2 TaxID=1734444 RepID=UPI0027DF231D|nr:TadE/TadG family type IV pilus assembly protein [Actinoplanes sp. M2I2]